MARPFTKYRLARLSFLGCIVLLFTSGCPNPGARNWPSERLDSNPSTEPVAVVVADMDRDGLLDVVSLWRGESQAEGRLGTVAIHFQNPGLQWSTMALPAHERYRDANALTVGDVNHDQRMDVVVAAHDRITYLRAPAQTRNPDHWTTFDISASIRDEFLAWFDVALAQIDGRRGLDIVATLNDPGRLVWFASPENPDSADGWQIHSIDSTTRTRADSLTLVDLDEDGRLDVVCSAPGDTNGVISWYSQPADPTTTPWPKHVMTRFTDATRLAMGDLDADGRPDLAAISPQAAWVAWFPHPHQATQDWNGWVLADYTPLRDDDREPVDIAMADIDGNGQLDVVVACVEPASVFWYTPREDNRLPWTEHRIAAVANAVYGLIDVADTDGDGFRDVIVPVVHESDETLDRIERFVNPTTAPAD